MKMSSGSSEVLQKIRRVADYQFGRGVGKKLFPDNIAVVFSKRTGRIKYVYLDEKLLATLKPTVGFFSLTIEGAEKLIESLEPKRLWVQIQEDAVVFVAKGGDVFARHVVNVDEEIRPREEVIVLDEKNRVIAVGTAMLSGKEMVDFKRGVAVKVRKGDLEKIKKEKEKVDDRKCQNCVE